MKKFIGVLFVGCVALSLQASQSPQSTDQSGKTYPQATYPQGTYPGQTYPSATYPGATYPGDTYPAGTYPGNTYPQGTYPGGTYPGETYPGATYPSGTYPGQTYPKETYPKGTYPGNTYPGETYPGQEAEPLNAMAGFQRDLLRDVSGDVKPFEIRRDKYKKALHKAPQKVFVQAPVDPKNRRKAIAQAVDTAALVQKYDAIQGAIESNPTLLPGFVFRQPPAALLQKLNTVQLRNVQRLLIATRADQLPPILNIRVLDQYGKVFDIALPGIVVHLLPKERVVMLSEPTYPVNLSSTK